MARDPEKGDSPGKRKRGKPKGASGRRGAPKRAQKRVRKSAAKAAKTATRNRRASGRPSSEPASLARELREAQARQAATDQVLNIIASSRADLSPVFDAIVKSAVDLCGARFGAVFRMEGDLLHLVADHNFGPIQRELLGAMYPMVPNRGHISGRAILDRGAVQIPDIYADQHYKSVEAKKAGFRSLLALPLLQGNRANGSIVIYRTEPGAFTERQSALLQSFAAQALIAIENTRLFNETREALERQTATADILKVIASSPDDVQPVFDAIAESARRVIGGHSALVTRVVGDGIHLAAFTTGSEAGREKLMSTYPQPLSSPVLSAQVLRTGQVVFYADTERDADDLTRGFARARGYRSVVSVPMLRDGTAIGTINVTRVEPGEFGNNTIGLLKTFADQAVIAIENARLFNETREALAQQTATSEVLRVISNSIADTAPVFEKILDSCENLFATEQLGIFLVQPDGQTHVGAWRGDAVEAVIQSLPRPADETATGLVIRNRAVLHIPNTATAQDVPPTVQFTRDQYGDISIAWAPMLTEQGGIGSIAVMRQPPNPFSQKELALLKTFADQAVIAIQNTRLFNETREALARQTATADVLKVIASSPSNLQPVFDAIAERSNGLMHGHSTTVFRLIGNMIELVASTSVSEAADAILRAAFPRPRSTMSGLDLAFRGEMRETIDAQSDAEPQSSRDLARARGFRGRLVVPLKSDSGTIGAISVTRKEPGAFADKDKELLRTFADQAVIAIQNVELFEQVQAKTRDLEESLQQQTATSDVLKMIASSPGDLTPMFDVMLECATRLCEASHCHVWRFDGQLLHAVAVRGDPWFAEWLRKNSPVAPILGSAADRIARGEDIVHVVDRREEEAYSSSPVFRDLVDSSGMRASLSVALRRDGALLGMINVYRQEARPFSDKQIALLQNFADQAIIAMENARLFNETREALARQTATSDVLKVIASSPSNLQPVFDAIAERSKALIGGHSTTVFRFAGDMVELVGATSVGAEADAVLRATFPMPISKMQNIDRTLRGEVSEIVDVMADTQPDDSSKNVARARGWRSRLVVPLKGDNEAIGFISITRKEPGAFADKDKELVRTFADQAVIAIQNVELFEEVQAKTRDLEESLEQQTATADVLKVISRSAFDLQAVLDTLVESAYGLCGASLGLLYLRGEEAFECKAVAGVGVEAASELFKGRPIRAGRSTAAERVILTGEVHAVTDFFADPEFDPIVRDRIRNDSSGSNISQLRSTLAVPMMRENEVVGVMVIARPQTGTFPQRQTELLQTFADQAVIAIENARLFEQVQDRTRELSQSLDELRTAQDRLVQTEKLASLGQLTAGIAHEIKNPLNFVNNFSALSVELTDELNDVLKQAELTEKIQREVGELTQMLKSNLEKVVQHGKRADSIVKNMLLHSREGSGEQRAADINALVEESLNLAYHGARAEKAGFNITLQREFDAGAGSAELFPQEITRALLNLISNGFYAATRRKAENGDDSFEPMLLATTRNLGHAVEIRIRDNGTGIPSGVKEKMFNPFFTTKPAGEGTGLGLSMTHDIIVKQHGGTIDVATEPGHFTEFIVVLPRTNGAPGRSRDQA